jgi:hypothetical protein
MSAVALFDEEFQRLKALDSYRKQYQKQYRETHKEYYANKQKEYRHRKKEMNRLSNVESPPEPPTPVQSKDNEQSKI